MDKDTTYLKPQILIAEDNYANYLFLRILLHDLFLLDWAKDGEEAIGLFKNKKYALILMDYQMPKFNGTEVTSFIRKTDKNIPIIAQTGYDMHEQELRKAGCNDVIIKPIRKNILLKKLEPYFPEINLSTL